MTAGQSRSGTKSGAIARILLVDDDALCRRAVTHILTGSGHSVCHVSDGREALRELGAGKFDVVVSDFSMPKMDGFELLRRVREQDPYLPFILYSGDTSLTVAAEAIERGANRYLLKPLDVVQLLAAIEHCHQGRVDHDHGVLPQGLASTPPGSEDSYSESAVLDHAMGTLWVAHQPIVRASDYRLRGYELFTRVDSPLTLGPRDLLQLAQRCNRLHSLGRQLRDRAASAAALLPHDGLVFVNLHPSELSDAELLDAHSPLAKVASRVVLELTDRRRLGEIPDLVARVDALRGLGFKLAIDDVGIGYSGLNTIALLEPEFVKIDRSLVSGIDSSPIHERVVASVMRLATDLGMTVVCEGVETEAEREKLSQLGVHLLQGYLIGRPSRYPTVPPGPTSTPPT